MIRKSLMILRRPLIAALLAGATALPASAETLADAMVDAFIEIRAAAGLPEELTIVETAMAP